jgi:hypothetical protein
MEKCCSACRKNYYYYHYYILIIIISIPCNDFDNKNGGNLQNSYSSISFDEGVYHSLSQEVILMLQSCTDSLQVLPGSSSETFPTSSDGAFNFNNMEVEEDVVVVEEGLIAVNEEASIGIKQEVISEDKFFPNEVSYVCVCLLLDTFYQCPEMLVVFVMPMFLARLYSYMVG